MPNFLSSVGKFLTDPFTRTVIPQATKAVQQAGSLASQIPGAFTGAVSQTPLGSKLGGVFAPKITTGPRAPITSPTDIRYGLGQGGQLVRLNQPQPLPLGTPTNLSSPTSSPSPFQVPMQQDNRGTQDTFQNPPVTYTSFGGGQAGGGFGGGTGGVPRVENAFTQLSDLGRNLAGAQSLATQRASAQTSLVSAQSQLSEAQRKLSTINQARTAGFGGNTYEGALAFQSGIQEDEDETEEGRETEDALRLQTQSLEALIGAQGPTPEQTAAEQQFQNVITSRDLGIEAARAKPIATPFIRGMESGIQRQAEISTRPLLQQLSNFQRAQELRKDISQIRYQAASEGVTRADRRDKERKEEAQAKQQVDSIARVAMSNPSILSQLSAGDLASVIPSLENKGFDFGKLPEDGQGELRSVSGVGVVRISPTGYELVVPEGKTQKEEDRATTAEIIKRAQPILMNSRQSSPDGFVSPNFYISLRNQYAQQFGAVKGFDDLFSWMLSPAVKAQLGITKTPSGTVPKPEDEDLIE